MEERWRVSRCGSARLFESQGRKLLEAWLVPHKWYMISKKNYSSICRGDYELFWPDSCQYYPSAPPLRAHWMSRSPEPRKYSQRRRETPQSIQCNIWPSQFWTTEADPHPRTWRTWNFVELWKEIWIYLSLKLLVKEETHSIQPSDVCTAKRVIMAMAQLS